MNADQVLELLRLRVIPIAVIVVVAWLGLRVARPLMSRAVDLALGVGSLDAEPPPLIPEWEARRRRRTLDELGLRTVRLLIYVFAGLSILATIGFDIGPAVAGLGLGGLAIALGAQTLVKDYLNGILIIVESQFSIGDEVTIAGVTGTVEKFGLRRTIVRDPTGSVNFIPNSLVLVATNHTRLGSQIDEKVTVAPGTSLEQAIAVLNEVGRTLYADPAWSDRLREPPQVDGVDAIGDLGISIRVRGRTRPTDGPAASREWRGRVTKAFEAKGIQLAQPGS
jgi:small-conductance mechanosensitive channel